MHTDDTIVALSTPPGRGGLGVIRLSGAESVRIVRHLVSLAREPEPWRAQTGELLDPASGAAVDRVVVTYFRKPHSYTAEDVMEVSCHGSPVVLEYFLRRALESGARLAEPGEFTLRAFLNGRMDLAQAEAVRDLIEAQTLYQAKVAAQQVDGAVSRRLAPIKKELVDLVALLEAGIDFAEDDVAVLSREEVLRRIETVRAPLEEYAGSFRYGRVVREGLVLAIAGRPNVGKSSLFNRLLERDRAIVTAAPGTTRDLVSEMLNLDGIPLKLVDTAGIREAADEAETIGVRKSFEALADADLTLVVFDASAGLTSEDRELIERVPQALVVANKIDLCASPEAPVPAATSRLAPFAATVATSRLAPIRGAGPGGPGSGLALPLCGTATAVCCSALTGAGLPELRRAILSAVMPALDGSRESGFLTNVRHERLIRGALEALESARLAAGENLPHEMLLLDLYNVLGPLNAITGETTVEDILNQIFSTFCIGK